MKKKAAILISGLILIVLLFVLLAKKPGREPFELKRTDVDYRILASCTVSFPEPYEIKAKSEGDILLVPVAEGQRVKKGDLLVQIDDFKEKQNLAIAVSNYENVKLKLVNAREETYPKLQEQLNDAEALLGEARNQAERLKSLYDNGAVSKVEFEKAQTRLTTARTRFNQVRLQLDSYKSSGTVAELINELNILNARLELSRRTVDEKKLTAPYDCTVIQLDVKKGESAAAGRTLAVILEKKPWILETNVDQKELGFLETGLPSFVIFDAYPTEKVRADISLVCSVIDYTKGTCNLKLQVAEEKAFIKHGMTGSVEITGKKIPGVNVGVLALPAHYIGREPGGNFVFVKKGKNITKQAVEFIPIGEKWVSVKNLPEGTRIVLPE